MWSVKIAIALLAWLLITMLSGMTYLQMFVLAVGVVYTWVSQFQPAEGSLAEIASEALRSIMVVGTTLYVMWLLFIYALQQT